MTDTNFKCVSIIIPVKIFNSNLAECLSYCQKLDYPDFEVIVLPDDNNGLSFPGVKFIPTGNIGPSDKRDIGARQARGTILAFIDDDTFPRADWLKNAVSLFTDPDVAAVGGPAVTPDNDDIRQQASGAVFNSWLASGNYTYRYLPRPERLVDDFPSCNFIVRHDIFEQVGGFNSIFWPGEDTVICLKITRDLGKKIIYSPDILIWHHRRRLFRSHWLQVWNYGMHRGYFVKRFPETSFRFTYFAPSVFVIGLLFGWLLIFLNIWLEFAYRMGLLFYFLVVLLESLKVKPRLMPLVFLGIFTTHLVYGVGFIKGLLIGRLKEEENKNQ